MSYEQIKDLRPAEFKRYYGVEPETFKRMVELVFQSSHQAAAENRTPAETDS